MAKVQIVHLFELKSVHQIIPQQRGFVKDKMSDCNLIYRRCSDSKKSFCERKGRRGAKTICDECFCSCCVFNDANVSGPIVIKERFVTDT